MRARRAARGVLVTLLAVGGVAALASRVARGQAAAGPETEPVPSAWLGEGGRLVLAGENCALEAPDPGWRWLRLRAKLPESTSIVLCVSPDAKERILLQVEDERFPRLTADFVTHFLTSYESALAAKGLALEKVEVEPSDVPLANRSFRFRDVLVDRSGKRSFSHGYITTARRLYLLDEVTPDGKAPAGLAKAAASFRLLRNAGDFDVGSQSLGLLVVAILAALTVFLGAALMTVVLFLRGKTTRGAART